MDRTLYHIKWAAMEELREALKLKEINEELLDQLASGLRWLIHYSSKYQIPLPEKDKMSALIDRTMAIGDKIPSSSDELLQSKRKRESDDNETEPFIGFCCVSFSDLEAVASRLTNKRENIIALLRSPG